MKHIYARGFVTPIALALIASACNQTATTKLDSGVIFEEATLTVSPTAFSYPNTAIGADSAVQKFTLTNLGVEPTGPISHVIDGPSAGEFFITGSTCAQPLGYMASCDVSVVFRPLTQGSKSARLTASATPGKTFSVSLSASSMSPAAATINPMIGTFQPVPIVPPTSSMAPMPQMIGFMVTNTGGSAAVLEATLDGADAGEFQMADGCSGPLLQPTTSCGITVFFSPSSAGMKSATLTVTGDHIKLTVPLSGAATNPPMLALSSTMQDFGSVQFGMSNIQQFSVTNNGGQPSGKLSVNVVGASSAGFSIVNTTCVDVLNPQDSCTILVSFAPVAANGVGQKTGLLNVSAPMGGNLTATLTGSAVALVTQGMLALTSIGGTNPFGQVSVGNMATAVYSVQNNGTMATGKIMASLAGSGNEFAVTNNGCPDMLGINETCLLTVTFTPQIAGSRTAVLQVFASPGGYATQQISAIAVPGPLLSITPNFNSFGTRNVNNNNNLTATPTVFTVRNIGSDVSGPVNVQLEGADMANFQLVATDCQNQMLQPRGASCTVRIRFVPTVVNPNMMAFLSAGAMPGNTVRSTLNGAGK
jgi:hypothetical protein